MPLIRGEPGAHGAEYTYAEWQNRMVIVGKDAWRFVWNPLEVVPPGKPFGPNPERGFTIEAEELYDLAADPLQQTNIIEAHPEVAAALRERACAFVTEKPFHRQVSTPIPEGVRERLRALGYVQDTREGPEARIEISQFCPDIP